MLTYILPIPEDTWSNTEEHLLNYVSNERKKKISTYLFSKDKILSLYAALLTRFLLSNLTGIPMQQLSFQYEPLKKPKCISEPSCDFSISHTKGCIFCGVTPNGRIGVDIEKILTPPYEVMKHSFHPNEISYVTDAISKNQPEHFYEIWTKKEAYTKLLGTGLSAPITTYNTLDTHLIPYLTSAQYNGYQYSVCADQDYNLKLQIYSKEELIQNFLL